MAKISRVVAGTPKPVPAPPTVSSSVPTINLKAETLPSKSLSYPKGCEIHYRPYTFGEVKKISQSKMSLKDSFKLILDGIECSFNKMHLTVSDLLFLALLRKLSTLGTSRVTAVYHCPACDKDGETHFSANEIEFDEISAPELPITVEFSFGELVFGVVTVEKFFKLLDSNKANDDLALLASACSNRPFSEVYKLFFDAPIQDGALIEELDQILYHGIKSKKVKCSNKIDDPETPDKKIVCGHEINIELDGGEVILLPFRDDKIDVPSRIRFGTQTSHKPAGPRADGLHGSEVSQ